jgi:hypothetical protein
MYRVTVALLLTSSLLAGAPASAQVVPPTEPAETTTDLDVGVLQAELARVEAERQRLEEELAGGEPRRLEQLELENQSLRERLVQGEEALASQREDERQRWFMIGGATVGGSLLLGLLLGKSGGRRRRREWLN